MSNMLSNGRGTPEYIKRVNRYLSSKGYYILSKIFKEKNGEDICLSYNELEQILGKDYPKAPWIKPWNKKERVSQFLRTAGCKFHEGRYSVVIANAHYKDVVNNYLNLSGIGFWENVSRKCQESGGYVTFQELEYILGEHYPKAPGVDKSNKKMCIIMFLNQLDVPYFPYESYVIFP